MKSNNNFKTLKNLHKTNLSDNQGSKFHKHKW